MFIAAAFTIAKIWKQPKCPLIDEYIAKLWYIYTIEYYSAAKKEETPSEISEISQSENEKYHIVSLIFGN